MTLVGTTTYTVTTTITAYCYSQPGLGQCIIASATPKVIAEQVELGV